MNRNRDQANAIIPSPDIEFNRDFPTGSNIGFRQDCPTLATFTHRLIAQQLHRIQKYQAGVVENIDPEPLHQTRVAMRRLRTALQVFSPILALPKPLREPILKGFAQTLGSLRDLDVQMLALGQSYRQRLSELDAHSDLETLSQIQYSLQQDRKKRFKQVAHLLKAKAFLRWKEAWSDWLEQPTFQGLSTIPTQIVLPDLFFPVVSKFLLYPGWQIPFGPLSTINAIQLHDLRKCCKQVRYQAEFFVDFYPTSFSTWIHQLKTLQDCLGQLQDTAVLKDWLGCQSSGMIKSKASSDRLTLLSKLVDYDSQTALQEWDQLRQPYLTAEFRSGIYQMILQPKQL